MTNKKIITLIVAATTLLFIALSPWCFGAWDNTLPADTSTWNNAAGEIRANWDALEAAFGVDLGNVTTGTLPVFDITNPTYGAVADGDGAGGGTDNTTAIDAAITAANAAGGGKVYVPIGIFEHTGLTAESNVTIEGDGAGSRLHNTSTGDAISHSGSNSDRLTGFHLKSLRISGTASSQSGVSITFFTLQADESINSIRNCEIDTHGNDGIELKDGDTFDIFGNYVHDNNDNGIFIDGTGTHGTNRIRIEQNNIDENGDYGIELRWTASTCNVIGNHINNNVTGGLYCYATEFATISENAFNSNDALAVTITGQFANTQSLKLSENINLKNNLFGDNSTGEHVSVKHCRNINIDGNTFFFTTEDKGIKVGNVALGVNIGPRNMYYSSTVLDSAQADDGGDVTDETTEAGNVAAGDMTLLPAIPAQEDAYYFGSDYTFNLMFLMQSTQGAGTWTIVWEYYNGSSWTTLTTTANTIDQFKGTADWHRIRFPIPINWATVSVNGETAYYIRARVSSYTSVTTQPKGSLAWIMGNGIAQVDVSGINVGWYTERRTDPDYGAIRHINATAANPVIETIVAGDQYPRLEIEAQGRILQGDGTATPSHLIETYTATVELTSTNIKALVGTPITLVAAQGADTLIEFLTAILIHDAAVAYAEPSAPDDLVIEFDNGDDVSQEIDATGFLTVTNDEIRRVDSLVTSDPSTDDLADNKNDAIRLINTGGDYTTGTGTMTVIVSYRVHTLGL